MTVIGLTGNIGSGKSSVSRLLQERGCKMINADDVGRIVVEPGQSGNIAIRENFGAEFFDENGNLLRKKLGAHVFADPARVELLDSILHPTIDNYMYKMIDDYYAEDPECVIILEAAIIFETGFQDVLDEIWVVAADDEIRVQRVMARDGISEAAVRDRIANQLPQADKIAQADRVVWNNGDLAELKENVNTVWEAFCNEKRGGKLA